MDLEIGQHREFQKKEWLATRIGWVLIALFLLAGLLGFLGPGPFSQTTATSDSGYVAVEFQRIGHNNADDNLTLDLSNETVTDGKVTVHLTGTWPESVDITGVSPQPSAEYAVPGGTAYEFEVLDGADVSASFAFRATGYGPLDATASVDGDSVDFTQFVLP
ncbi:hypothetical protein [Zhihengliuella sp.]|uniref:hypothetical protein n=1 Tax=Zhihengliuella sp. TaxID=1954483 RepID=UPI002810A663|nr:hypothetical protein [Zhihengliuella sp.]